MKALLILPPKFVKQTVIQHTVYKQKHKWNIVIGLDCFAALHRMNSDAIFLCVLNIVTTVNTGKLSDFGNFTA